MEKNKYKRIITIIAIVILSIVFLNLIKNKRINSGFSSKQINPSIGDIRLTVSTTGIIEPQNRLEIKPSISGRIEKIMVKEGDRIKQGDILAWMSSTERAALVDAAHSQGDKTLKYWQEVYKQTPIISPIDGEVIVRSVEPGQTVTTADAVMVLSDRLIVSAQFDETDIGKIKVGQEAIIALDAYSDVQINGVVDHIAYESELVNNVTIYNVDILPKQIPEFFRSGMSANVEVIQAEQKGIILLPAEAIHREDGKTFVMVREKPRRNIQQREVKVGLTDEKNVEIISGLSTEDTVIIQSQAYTPQQNKESGTNPFMPFHRRKK